MMILRTQTYQIAPSVAVLSKYQRMEEVVLKFAMQKVGNGEEGGEERVTFSHLNGINCLMNTNSPQISTTTKSPGVWLSW